MHKVLIIDDEEIIREPLGDLLRLENYEVAMAASGDDGLALAKTELPDIILCDIMLPGRDGYSVFEVLRADPRTTQIPVIFLTARADRSDVRLGMELGADDYLCKPVSKQELLAAIATRLAKSQHSSTLFNRRIEALSVAIGSAVSHELLTPLAGIIGHAQLLAVENPAPASQDIKDMAESIALSANRLHATIRHLLDYVSLRTLRDQSTRVAQLSCQPPEDAEPIVREAALKVATEAKRVTDLKLAVQPKELHLPSTYLHLAVTELASNAFKFSCAGTPVEIGLSVGQQTTKLTVVDCGRGMNSQAIRSIGAFRQFERAKYEQQGLGLGLEIVQLISVIFGAELEVTSVVGKGTKVTLEGLR
jgi:two-component system, sensor histidine kinase and response regulator